VLVARNGDVRTMLGAIDDDTLEDALAAVAVS
jgi:hypothetical protein